MTDGSRVCGIPPISCTLDVARKSSSAATPPGRPTLHRRATLSIYDATRLGDYKPSDALVAVTYVTLLNIDASSRD